MITSLQRGGAERLTLDLTTELDRRGVLCQLVTIGRPTRQALAMPKGAIDLAPFALDRGAAAEAVGRIARGFHADLIHGHLLDGAMAALVAAERVPLVMTVHNQRPGWPDGLKDIEAGRTALLIACARAVEADLIGAGLRLPVRVAWNGIDPSGLVPIPDRLMSGRRFRRRLRLGRNDFVLLILANPRTQKRFDRLPDVLAVLRAELARRGVQREARLVIAGEASRSNAAALALVQNVRTRFHELGLTRHVRWAGMVTDVSSALAAANVLISTSDYEGLSLAQLEAMAAGVPVVTTDAGGARELEESGPGVTVLPRNATPEQFATVLVEHAATAVTATLPAHFTTGTMARRYTWLYSRSLTAARTRTRGDGLMVITNNLSLGGAQSSARRLIEGVSARRHSRPCHRARRRARPPHTRPARPGCRWNFRTGAASGRFDRCGRECRSPAWPR